jgi:hypothetical protein
LRHGYVTGDRAVVRLPFERNEPLVDVPRRALRSNGRRARLLVGEHVTTAGDPSVQDLAPDSFPSPHDKDASPLEFLLCHAARAWRGGVTGSLRVRQACDEFIKLRRRGQIELGEELLPEERVMAKCLARVSLGQVDSDQDTMRALA